MKKTITFLKTFLVAAGLLVGGANVVWADNANLTPTADTYFSWSNGDTSYGSEGTLYCGIWQEYWTNATPGLKANNSSTSKIAVFKFDVSDYKGKITAATFKVTGTNPSTNSNTRSIYLGYFDLTNWDESSTANNSGMLTRDANNLNIHPFSLSQSIAKGQTKEVSFSNDALLSYLNEDEDGIVSLVVYGVGQECSVNSKEAASGKPSLALTYTNETVYTATFTANEGALIPEVAIYSDETRQTSVSNGTLTDQTTYYYRAVLAGYNNYEGSFTVNGAAPSVSFTMIAKTRYTFTVNAINSANGAVVKTIYTDADSYEGKTHSMVYPKYLTGANNIVTYSKDDNTYGESKTAQAKDETYTVSYTAYDGVAYFVEVEDVITATTYSSWNCSNGSAVRGFTTAKSVFTIPATGNYNITYGICNNNVNYDLYCILSKNDSEISTSDNLKSVSINYIKTTGIVTNNDVSLASGDVLKLTPSSTNGIVDYMLIELKSVPATIGAKGYTTFASPYALDLSSLPDGLTAYYVESENINKANNYVKLTEVTEAVAAGTGLLLEGTANKSYDFTVVASGTDLSATNKMIGCPTATDITKDTENYENFYVMVNGETEPEFQNLKNYLDNNEKVTIPAGKAYLDATGVDAARLSIVFDDNETTGISDVRSKTEDVRGFYDLQGRRVAQPTKGLYIVSGKKVIVK